MDKSEVLKDYLLALKIHGTMENQESRTKM